MLALRPNCECCDADIAWDSPQAFICSFECTWCSDCANGRLGLKCPNCGGGLVPRPVRPPAALARFPGQTGRTRIAAACADLAGRPAS